MALPFGAKAMVKAWANTGKTGKYSGKSLGSKVWVTVTYLFLVRLLDAVFSNYIRIFYFC